jgi:hypothetical protein
VAARSLLSAAAVGHTRNDRTASAAWLGLNAVMLVVVLGLRRRRRKADSSSARTIEA